MLVSATYGSSLEQLWEKYFTDPTQWRDCRNSKLLFKFPHLSTKGVHGINSPETPEWLTEGVTKKKSYKKAVGGKVQNCSGDHDVGKGGNVTEWRFSQQDVFSWTTLISQHTKRGEGREALRMYEAMREAGVRPSPYTFVAALKACSRLGDLETGKKIHAHVIESGYGSRVFVANVLVDMYGKCGSIVEARSVFDEMPQRDVVSWNTMISGYAQKDNGKVALQFYARMTQEGISPNDRTFVSALKACSSLAASEEGKEVDGKVVKKWCLEQGRAIHSDVVKSGFQSDMFVSTMLVDMYGKCGSMEDARQVFEKMPHRDVVSWNAMILGYAQMEEGEVALQLYAQMRQEAVVRDERTFVAALKACSSLAALEVSKEADGKPVKRRVIELGRAIHLDAVKSGFESQVFVATMLVDMYGKCRSMADALLVFERMPHRSVVSWNAIILGYAQMEEGDMALQLYSRMQREGGVLPDECTFVSALKACGSLAALADGNEACGKPVKEGVLEQVRAIHSEVARCRFESDISVANMLMSMYAKCESMEDARHVFEKIAHRDVVSWNAIISGYVQMEESEVGLQMFARMQREGISPDERTFVLALKACSCLASLEEGEEASGKFVKKRWLEQGIAIHSEVVKSGFESDMYVATMLVDMYGKCENMGRAQHVFDMLSNRDLVAWNALIAGYAEQGDCGEVFKRYLQMQEQGLSSNSATFVSILKACGNSVALETGKKIHAHICSAGLSSVGIVATALIDMYGKCGSMLDAQQVFDALPTRDVVTWGALIAGYARQGENDLVCDLFQRMRQEGIQPNEVTFLSVLTVCSHAGLVDKGREYLESMSREYDITPNIRHYTCLVDLLGRAGQLEEAMAMVEKMPFQPNPVTWKTLLGACHKWNNVEIGSEAFKCVVRLSKNDSAAYVLMSNIYADAHMWDDVKGIQAMRVEARAWKTPGQSWWTDIGGMVHTFAVGDEKHPESKEIYAMVNNLHMQVEEGFVPEIPDDEKDDSVRPHCQAGITVGRMVGV